MPMRWTWFSRVTTPSRSLKTTSKRLHGVLLKYSSKDQERRGHYKKLPNDVDAFGPNGKSLGVVVETATPFETPGWMKELVNWFNGSVSEESVVVHGPTKALLLHERLLSGLSKRYRTVRTFVLAT